MRHGCSDVWATSLAYRVWETKAGTHEYRSRGRILHDGKDDVADSGGLHCRAVNRSGIGMFAPAGVGRHGAWHLVWSYQSGTRLHRLDSVTRRNPYDILPGVDSVHFYRMQQITTFHSSSYSVSLRHHGALYRAQARIPNERLGPP